MTGLLYVNFLDFFLLSLKPREREGGNGRSFGGGRKPFDEIAGKSVQEKKRENKAKHAFSGQWEG